MSLMQLVTVGEGRTAEVFEWEAGRVVKLLRPGWGEDGARSEAAVAAGAPIPTCHGVVRVEERWGIVYERLPGPVMGDTITSPDRVMAAMEALALLQGRIHSARIDGVEPIGVRWSGVGQLAEHPYLAAAVEATLASLQRAVAALP